jgi:hypothetical protein
LNRYQDFWHPISYLRPSVGVSTDGDTVFLVRRSDVIDAIRTAEHGDREMLERDATSASVWR